MTDCIFCKIVSGDIPAQIIDENDSAILIKDKNPMAPHHVLSIVKEHFDDVGELYGLDSMAILHNVYMLFDFYVIANNLNKSGYRIITNSGPDAGQTVKHLHFHLLGGSPLKNDFGV
jgi:histidine triad (HIT) family protein